ncbi:MAG: hypothetical protein DYH17_02295 [Xanthomonadales bacterium PRO6]|nr:hypothetical protein [Xanthomonadales bacterium PRO6]
MPSFRESLLSITNTSRSTGTWPVAKAVGSTLARVSRRALASNSGSSQACPRDSMRWRTVGDDGSAGKPKARAKVASRRMFSVASNSVTP